jgi:hypothetical protein
MKYDEIFQALVIAEVLLRKPFLDLGFDGVVRWKWPASEMLVQSVSRSVTVTTQPSAQSGCCHVWASLRTRCLHCSISTVIRDRFIAAGDNIFTIFRWSLIAERYCQSSILYWCICFSSEVFGRPHYETALSRVIIHIPLLPMDFAFTVRASRTQRWPQFVSNHSFIVEVTFLEARMMVFCAYWQISCFWICTQTHVVVIAVNLETGNTKTKLQVNING